MSAHEPARPVASAETPRRGPPPPGGGGEREYDLLLRESPRGISVAQGVLGILIRLLGLALLVVGLTAAVAVLVEAWKLYQAPERMERFAVAVERGSNLDKIFAIPADAAQEGGVQDPATVAAATGEHLRLSYFVAWFVVLLLLLIVSIIALSTVSAGGRLALYDTDVRQLSKAVVREVRRRR